MNYSKRICEAKAAVEYAAFGTFQRAIGCRIQANTSNILRITIARDGSSERSSQLPECSGEGRRFNSTKVKYMMFRMRIFENQLFCAEKNG